MRQATGSMYSRYTGDGCGHTAIQGGVHGCRLGKCCCCCYTVTREYGNTAVCRVGVVGRSMLSTAHGRCQQRPAPADDGHLNLKMRLLCQPTSTTWALISVRLRLTDIKGAAGLAPPVSRRITMRRCGSPLAPRLYVYDLPPRYREDPREAVGLGTAIAGVVPLEHMPEGVQLWHTAEVCRLTRQRMRVQTDPPALARASLCAVRPGWAAAAARLQLPVPHARRRGRRPLPRALLHFQEPQPANGTQRGDAGEGARAGWAPASAVHAAGQGARKPMQRHRACTGKRS